ncbi:MAG: alpha/beta fold hydrolase [Culicoidibacterales bacterium]
MKQKFRKILAIIFISFISFVCLFIIVTVITLNMRLTFTEQYDYQDDAPGQYITVQGYDLHYQIIGEPTEKPPILFLHGFNAAASHEWSKIAPYLAEYQLILVDHLGMGYSQRILEPNPILSIQGQSNLYADFIKQLGYDHVNLIGVSYAGAIATQLAFDAPDLINQLILIGPQLLELGGGGFSTLSRLPFGIGSGFTYFAMGAGFFGTELYALDCNFEPIGFCPSEEDRAIRQRQAEIRGTTASFMAYNTTPQQTSLPDALQHLQIPTLFIYGEADSLQGGAMQTVQTLLPTAEMQIIANNYHTPHLQSPEATAQPIREFFDE